MMSATHDSPKTARSFAFRTADDERDEAMSNDIDCRRAGGSALSRSACTASMLKLLAAAGSGSLSAGLCACYPKQVGSCMCPNDLPCSDCRERQLESLRLECRGRCSIRSAGCHQQQPCGVNTADEYASLTTGQTFADLLAGLKVHTASNASSFRNGSVRLSASASAGILHSLSVQQQRQEPAKSLLLDPSRPSNLLLQSHSTTSAIECSSPPRCADAACDSERVDAQTALCLVPPPLPPPRRLQHLPLKQHSRLAHQPLSRSQSSDGRRIDVGGGVHSERAVRTATYKVPRVRTVSDVSLLNVSAFFKPIESASSHQPSNGKGTASQLNAALSSTSLAVRELDPADRVAADDSDHSCPGGLRSNGGKPSRLECTRSDTSHCTPPTAEDRLLHQTIMHCGVREEEEYDGGFSASENISVPLWHSWSGQELRNRLHHSTSKRNCSEKACDRSPARQVCAGHETNGVFACNSAISARGIARAIRDGSAPFGRQTTSTMSYAAEGNSESLCFATYKPPLSTTFAERRDFGSSTSLRRATLRMSSTSVDDASGREVDSTSSSPAVSPTDAVSERHLYQHRSADCLDQLDGNLGVADNRRPAAKAGLQQLPLAHDRGSPDTGKISPTHMKDTPSVAVLRQESDSSGRLGNPAVADEQNDMAPERSALTAAVFGKNDWYSDCGKGVAVAEMPSSPFRWSGMLQAVNVDSVHRLSLLDRARGESMLVASGMPSAAVQGSLPLFSGATSSHAPSDGNGEDAHDMEGVACMGVTTAHHGVDKETITVGRTAASLTMPCSEAADHHADSTEPSIPVPGRSTRSRRVVPRTNPHVFHRNATAGGECLDSSRRVAVGHCWSRVLSESCLVWSKMPQTTPSPITPSAGIAAAAAAGAAIIATICKDNRQSTEHCYGNSTSDGTGCSASSSGPSDHREGSSGDSIDCCDSSNDVQPWPELCRVGFLMKSADDGRYCARLTEGESYV